MLQQKILPGQKLLYRELTKLLKMSKTPIVNALNRLEQEGFVVSEPNCGYSIRSIDITEIMDSSEVREALETKAVSQAVQRGTAEGMAALKKKLDALESYPLMMRDKKQWVLNAEFHLQIAEMAENRVLKYLLKRNFEHIILRVNSEVFPPESTVESNREHRELFKSMQNKDVAASIALIERHIRKTKERVVRFLSRESVEDLETMDFF